MPRIELQPDLSRCIETVARDEYGQALRALLAGGDDEGLAERAELLRRFLETADFRDLRRQSERHLLGGKKVTFTVYTDEEAVRYSLEIS